MGSRQTVCNSPSGSNCSRPALLLMSTTRPWNAVMHSCRDGCSAADTSSEYGSVKVLSLSKTQPSKPACRMACQSTLAMVCTLIWGIASCGSLCGHQRPCKRCVTEVLHNKKLVMSHFIEGSIQGNGSTWTSVQNLVQCGWLFWNYDLPFLQPPSCQCKRPWDCPTYLTHHQQLSTWFQSLLWHVKEPGSSGTRKTPQLKSSLPGRCVRRGQCR
jgi:hypothetical protein